MVADSPPSTSLQRRRDQENSHVNTRRRRRRKPNPLLSAAAQTSQADFWLDQPLLAAAVVEASQSLAECGRVENHWMLLEEHTVDLMNGARRLIKQASEGADKDNTTACLCVAMYGLRTLSALPLTDKQRETSIKIVYHAITKAEECALVEYTLIGYETLGWLLHKCSLRCGRRRVGFIKPTTDQHDFSCFPCPTTTDKVGECSLSSEQLAGIAILSSFSVARAVSKQLTAGVPATFHFVSGLGQAILQGDTRLRSNLLVYLLSTIVGRWTIFLVESAEKDPTKDVLSHAKHAQYILWDAAGKLEDAKLCLELRGESVLCLLGSSVRDAQMRQDINVKHFDSACTYAWKAAMAYQQQGNSSPSAVLAFHERVGKLLDDEVIGDTVAYAEYCAIRALHTDAALPTPCANSCCLFRRMPFRFLHADCGQSGNASVMGLYFLALLSKQGMQVDLKDDRPLHARNRKAVLDSFQRTILEGQDKSALRHRAKYHKLVWSLSLHRAIFEAAESSLVLEQSLALETAAEILALCLGPLSFALTRKSSDKDEVQAAFEWSSLGESFIRAISAMEALASKGAHDAQYQRRSNVMMEDYVSLLKRANKSGMSPDAVSKASKFLALIGRRRSERGQDASLPMLLSLRLDLLWSDGSTTLSTRWLALGAAYTSCGRTDESILATTAAIAASVAEEATNDRDDRLIDLISYAACAMKDCGEILGPALCDETLRSSRQSMGARLASLMFSRSSSKKFDPSKDKMCSLSMPGVIDTLLRAGRGESTVVELFELRCGVPFTLGWLLQVSLTESALYPEGSPDMSVVSCERAKIAANVIFKQGKMIQTEASDMSLDSPAWIDFKHVLQLASSYLKKGCMGGESSQLETLQSVFHLLAAASLVSVNASSDFDRWCLSPFSSGVEGGDSSRCAIYADRYAAKAADSLESGRGKSQSDWELLAGSLLASVALFRAQLACTTSGSSALPFDVLQDTVASLSQGDGRGSIMNASKWCMIAVISRLCDCLTFHGCLFDAACLASWNDSLVRSISTEDSPWFFATALATEKPSTLLTNRQHCSLDLSEDEACTYEASATRLLRVFADGVATDADDRELSELLLTLAEKSTGTEGVEDMFHRWARSTAILVDAELAASRGEFDRACRLLKECFQQCQDLSSLLEKRWRKESRKSIVVPTWARVAKSTLALRCMDRQIDCVVKSAFLYFRLGDRRKAYSYALTAAKLRGVESSDKCNLSFADLLRGSREEPCQSLRESKVRRLLITIKALAVPLDLVQDQMNGCYELSSRKRGNACLRFSTGIDRTVEDMLDYLHVGSVLHDSRQYPVALAFERIYGKLDRLYQLVLKHHASLRSDLTEGSVSIVQTVPVRQRLHAARQYLLEGKGAESEAIDSGWTVINGPGTSQEHRAQAYYVLGLIELQRARKCGALALLWTGNRANQECIAKAQQFFATAREQVGLASDVLARDILRCSALVTGQCSTAAYLVNASIGRALCRQVALLLEGGEESSLIDRPSDDQLATVFRGCEGDACSITSAWMSNELNQRLPNSWRIVSLALCPTGELLISTMERSEGQRLCTRVACVTPETPRSRDSAYDSILVPLDKIVASSQDQLQDESAADANQNEEKRAWWDLRAELDSQLAELVDQVETQWFSSDAAREALSLDVDRSDRSFDSSSSDAGSVCGNLASKFDAVCLDEIRGSNYESLDVHLMTGDELRDELLSLGVPKSILWSMKKDALVDRLLAERQSRRSSAPAWRYSDDGRCTILILDENLHRFPFEAMKCFANQAVTRVPSLSFVLAKLMEQQHNELVVNPTKTRFVLDPESNLSGTQERIAPILDALNQEYGGSWKSVIGEAPDKAFVEQGLTAKDGLFLYFGHGNGRSYFSRQGIEALIRRDRNGQVTRQVQSSVILMGCSSGRLESVNRKDTKYPGQLPIHFEPEGIVNSYLAAGAPCVVGNLWDVTDRDIDRYSLALLDQFFRGDQSLPVCVAEARSACKLPYIVGCAPVCYGLPVRLAKR